MEGTDPTGRAARLQHALDLHRGGPLDAAARAYRELLTEAPDDADALNLLGVVTGQQGRLEEALELIGRALRGNPRHALAHTNRARVLLGLRRWEEALESAAQALRLEPRLLEALLNRAEAERALGRMAQALESCEQAVALQPGHCGALRQRGNLLLQLNRFEDALASFEHALRGNPRDADVWERRGLVLRTLGFATEALASYERALAIGGRTADTHAACAAVLHDLGRPAQAARSWERTLALAPDHPYALGNLLHARLQAGDWHDCDGLRASVESGVRAGKLVSTPFAFLSIADAPRAQLECARAFFADQHGIGTARPQYSRRSGAGRLSLGYLSADFREHATARLLVGVLERHDRSAFAITALSSGPDDRSPLRERVRRACDRFADVSRQSDREAAQLIRDLGIDILVDLNGFAGGGRAGILALRPAPIQASYLGYPGTLGTDCIDYLVADSFVIPEAYRHCYAEQIAYLPGCYQPNERERPRAKGAPQRADAGLPAEGIVFCCFNAPYKITPAVFGLWMRLLGQVPGSVLWLYQGNGDVADNLRREAVRYGVAPQRLVFAGHCGPDEHLVRYALADLFLDTLPVNAHTTASDALRAGVPVLTCSGESFAARVAGSLLQALGLPELITHSAAEYEARALELASDPAQLERIRRTLARNHLTHPLFDGHACCRNLEDAYRHMWERWQRGESPKTFTTNPRNETVTLRA